MTDFILIVIVVAAVAVGVVGLLRSFGRALEEMSDE